MDKRIKYTVLFLVGLVLFLIIIQQDSDYVITEIKDGSTLVLENGTTVKLIGVSSTKEGLAYLKSEFLNKPVNLLCDHSFHFDPSAISSGDVVYAYVIGGENYNMHINAHLLRTGKSNILEGTYLTDSLDAFRKYANVGEKDRNTDPTPTPTPVIDYEDDDIILPSPPSPDKKFERKYTNWSQNGNDNLKMLDTACDYRIPYTKQFANSLAGKSPGNFNAGQICHIFRYCYKNWKYVNDPNGHEYLATASESIENQLCGDCDDFAILMASCMLAIGGNACVNTGFTTQNGHAFTEVDISNIGEYDMLETIRKQFPQFDIPKLNTRRQGQHLWLNLDWWAAYPGGPYYECSRRDAYPCVYGKWSWERIK